MNCSKVVISVAMLLGLIFSSSFAYAQVEAEVQEVKSELFSNNYQFSDGLFESKPGKLELFWNARVYGEGASLATQSAQIGGSDINLKAKYTLMESLEARLFVRVKYESGRSQSFFGDLEPNNGFFAREAAVKYMPADFVDFKIGVIDQDYLEMPLLVDRQSFPGANVDLHHTFSGQPITIGANAQWAVPTSQTLSSRTIEREATPNYETQLLYARYKDSTFDAYQTVGRYSFKRLPSVVAWESAKYGNSTAFTQSENNSAFAFGFDGWFTQTGLKYRLNSLLEPMAYMQVIKNEDAPETYNDGRVIGVGTNIHLTNHIVGVKVENFFIESDAVPGFYNSWGYGHTNKEGNGGELSIAFLKYKFRLRAQYYETKTLNFDSFQQNQQYFYLGVETGYDKI